MKRTRNHRFHGLILTGIFSVLFSVIALSQNAPTGANPAVKGPAPDAAPEIIILTGNPMGGVAFRHRLHTQIREIQCSVCHHESRPQKPATSPYQPCRTCHTQTVSPPMDTFTQAAFHTPDASAGLCISCHKKEDAEHKHKLAPVTCQECHNPANVLPEPTAGK
jgi:hypothetical protein